MIQAGKRGLFFRFCAKSALSRRLSSGENSDSMSPATRPALRSSSSTVPADKKTKDRTDMYIIASPHTSNGNCESSPGGAPCSASRFLSEDEAGSAGANLPLPPSGLSSYL